MKKAQFIFSLMFCIFTTFSVFGNIINVPADYSSIQVAINSSVIGDTVLVQPGTYFEDIDFNGKSITVTSLYITTQDDSYIEQTIINAGGYGHCIKFDSGENSNSVINGFTATNGGSYYGSGIYCYQGSSPTISNMIITDNHGDSGDSYGGGMCIMEDSSPTCTNLIISNNDAEVGGGIYFHNNGNATLKDVTINGNTANHGGGLITNYSHPIFENALIYDNVAVSAGAGVYVWNHSHPDFINSTIVGNATTGWGGGFYCNSIYGEPNIINSIVWGNESEYDLQIFALGAYPEVTYSCIQDGLGEDWFGLGCIVANPLFVDEEIFDFNLTENSPCIDAGDPNSPYDPDSTIVDMGALFYNQNPSGIIENQVMTSNTRILTSAYPNPFNPSTTIRYQIFETAHTKLQIYNSQGQKVRTLVNSLVEAGGHKIVWDGLNDVNSKVASGIYFYQIQVEDTQSVKKMILLK